MSWPQHSDGRTMPMILAENGAFREALAYIAHQAIRKGSAEEMQARALEVLESFRYDPKPGGGGRAGCRRRMIGRNKCWSYLYE